MSAANPDQVRVPVALRYLDVIAVALAGPVFVLAGFPILGYLVGGLAWLVQRAIQLVLVGRAERAGDPRTRVGILTASMIGRGWLCALSIFGVGLYRNEAGLAAALLVVAVFTVYFTVQLILRPFDKPLPPREAAR